MTHTARVQVREPASNTRRRIARCFVRYDFLRWCVRRSLRMLAVVWRGGIAAPSRRPHSGTAFGWGAADRLPTRRARTRSRDGVCAVVRGFAMVPAGLAALVARTIRSRVGVCAVVCGLAMAPAGPAWRGGITAPSRRPLPGDPFVRHTPADHIYFARARVGVYGGARFRDESHRPPRVRARDAVVGWETASDTAASRRPACMPISDASTLV